jgi:hypothetical protein
MARTTIDIPVPDLSGKRAVLTGGSDGIGLVLARRLAAAGADLAQPGIGRAAEGREIRLIRRLSAMGIAGTPETAALPALLAATSPDAAGSRFYGPRRFGHISGAPAEQRLYRRLRSLEDAQRIWQLSEQLTNVSFPDGGADAGNEPPVLDVVREPGLAGEAAATTGT